MMNHIYPIKRKKEPWKSFHKKFTDEISSSNPNLSLCIYDEIEHKPNLTHERVQVGKRRRDGYNTCKWKIGWEEPKG